MVQKKKKNQTTNTEMLNSLQRIQQSDGKKNQRCFGAEIRKMIKQI